MDNPLLILKFGTASITKLNGEPDINVLGEIARQVSILQKIFRVVIVSSGAVGAGKHFISKYEGTISQRKAAAAIGNPILLKLYAEQFSKYGVQVAQSLCERQHFSNRQQFLQLKETYQELWKNNIIPIANENDVVSNRELKFSDNDELATLIAGGFGATILLLCTQSGGLLDKNGEIVNTVNKINEETLGLVQKAKTTLGLGGMASKLTFTNMATKIGIKVVIFGMKTKDSILEAVIGNTGTTFLPNEVNLSAKNKWLVSGGLSVGRIQLDVGAGEAILKRKSLLTLGIVSAEGDFEVGEVVELLNDQNQVIAIGQARLSAVALKLNLKVPNIIFVHADDLVLL